MNTIVDERLRREAEHYRFRFACDDCAHFDLERARCSLAYPAAPRRDALASSQIALCKDFDLG